MLLEDAGRPVQPYALTNAEWFLLGHLKRVRIELMEKERPKK